MDVSTPAVEFLTPRVMEEMLHPAPLRRPGKRPRRPGYDSEPDARRYALACNPVPDGERGGAILLSADRTVGLKTAEKASSMPMRRSLRMAICALT